MMKRLKTWIKNREKHQEITILIYLVILIICAGGWLFLDVFYPHRHYREFQFLLGLIVHIGCLVPFVLGILYFSRIVESRFGLVLATIIIIALIILEYFIGWGPWPFVHPG